MARGRGLGQRWLSALAAARRVRRRRGGDGATPATTVASAPAAPERAPAPSECETVEQLQVGSPGLPARLHPDGHPARRSSSGTSPTSCIEVELIDFESGVAAFRAMAAGEFDVGLSGSVSPILAFGEGADAVGFAASGAYLDFQVVATGDIDDLRGPRGPSRRDGRTRRARPRRDRAVPRHAAALDIDSDVELIVGDPETFVAADRAGRRSRSPRCTSTSGSSPSRSSAPSSTSSPTRGRRMPDCSTTRPSRRLASVLEEKREHVRPVHGGAPADGPLALRRGEPRRGDHA